ncbi:hypothetical protein VTN02DRAFT_913 [Thermoascus thermophilus]
MPLTSRRRTRRKDLQLQETSDAEAPDSSPSRPSVKKRKVGVVSGRASPSFLPSVPSGQDARTGFRGRGG